MKNTLKNFLVKHQIWKEIKGDTIEERHESMLEVNAPNNRRLVYCKGCGEAIIHLAGERNNEGQSNYERTIQFHVPCYQKAIEAMNQLRKDKDYGNE